ncbi:MAG TPA: hypothetical protein DCX00_01035 [Flavobacteriales bacterium]|jgi:hypothetical protein|nr:hypothetical protein [Flavobacteriales bacterium]
MIYWMFSLDEHRKKGTRRLIGYPQGSRHRGHSLSAFPILDALLEEQSGEVVVGFSVKPTRQEQSSFVRKV